MFKRYSRFFARINGREKNIMSRVLIFSDMHCSGRNPRSRIDDYYQSCLLKFDEILSLSKDCDIIISAGDLWDTSTVSNTMVDDLLDRIESNKKIFYVVFGNHDTNSYNLKASKSTSLAHMIRRSKYVKHLDEIKLDNFFIKGYDCKFGMEDELKKNGLFHKSNAENSLAVTHTFITIKPFISNVSHVLAKDIKSNYSTIWCSHFHSEFDEIINNHRFVNLSSIGRTSINEQHQPQVAIFDTETQEIQKIKLKSAKPANKIFDLSKHKEIKDKSKSIDEFIGSLNDTNFCELDTLGQINKIGKKNNVKTEIIDYLVKKTEEIKNVE